MSLPWVRLDTTMPDHPKIIQLVDDYKDGRGTAFIYICSMAYAGRHGTDGFIPKGALARIGGRPVDADRLVQVGLWHKEGTGWVIHGWAEYQQTNEETQERRRKIEELSRKGNCVRWHGEDCGCWRESP
jgi:hypothetical protein